MTIFARACPAVQMSGTCSAWQSRRSHCTTRRLAHTSLHNKTQAQQALTLVRRHSHIRWSCSRLCLRCVATRIVPVHLHGDHSTCTHIRSGPPPSCPHGVSSVALHCQVSLLEAVLFVLDNSIHLCQEFPNVATAVTRFRVTERNAQMT